MNETRKRSLTIELPENLFTILRLHSENSQCSIDTIITMVLGEWFDYDTDYEGKIYE